MLGAWHWHVSPRKGAALQSAGRQARLRELGGQVTFRWQRGDPDTDSLPKATGCCENHPPGGCTTLYCLQKHTMTSRDPPSSPQEARGTRGWWVRFTDGKVQTRRGGVTEPGSQHAHG